MIIQPDWLLAVGSSQANAARWLEHFNNTIVPYEIDSLPRVACWLAQVAHESGSFQYKEEVWGPTAAQETYQGRMGNYKPGDGERFKGHGLIQLTGRYNHERYAQGKKLTLEQALLFMQTDEGAADVAGWFWKWKNLNPLADKNDFLAISIRINGLNRQTGLPNGYHDRVARWDSVKYVMGI